MPRRILTVALATALCCGATEVRAQNETARRGFGWRNDRPAIIFGEDIYVGLRARAVFDWRGFDPDLEEDTFDLNVARIGRQRRADAALRLRD